MEKVSKKAADYQHDRRHTPKAHCGVCKHFKTQSWDCEIVIADSPGDDKGIIHPNAWCRFWRKEK